MTKAQTTIEMKYRLSKYIPQILLDAEMITIEEAVNLKEILCGKYDHIWKNPVRLEAETNYDRDYLISSPLSFI